MEQVLDECTSTLSAETAERIHWALASHEITVVTVSHRPKHKSFHPQQLTLTGEGEWSLAATNLGVLTPPATPPATPRAGPDDAVRNIRAGESKGSVKCGQPGKSSTSNAVLPHVTVVRRISMILQILVQRRRSTIYLATHIVFIFCCVGLQSKILAALPGQLQALAIQSNRAAYINLSIYAFVCRLLAAVSKFLSARAGNKLSIEWQGSLTQHIIDHVLRMPDVFYHLECMDKRVDDMETRVVSDINLLALALQAIITSMLTPISSAVLATRLLVSANLPTAAIGSIWAYAIAGFLIQKFAAPDYAGFAALKSAVQGVFRRGHQRLIANAESIAMMYGEERELENLNEMLDDITSEDHRQLYCLTRFNCFNYWFTQYVPILVTNAMRMLWALGYGSDQSIMSEANGTGISSQGLYIENLITESFTATVGILSLNNLFQTLVGHIFRVTDLLIVIDQIRDNTQATRDRLELRDPHPGNGGDGCAEHVAPQRGNEEVSLTDVDIVAPDGTELVHGLAMKLHPGERLMVTGSGKSSLFRVLTGLWHVNGAVQIPTGTLRVPQQPLVTCSPVNLLTYLCYPLELDQSEQAHARNIIHKYLEQLHVDYLIKREGWVVCRHWVDVLSLGELQCLALARVLFCLHHSTRRRTTTRYSWLFLDDCTSALTADVEAKVYRLIDEVAGDVSECGCKLGVVSFGSEQRETLSGVHDRLLRLSVERRHPSETNESKDSVDRGCKWQVVPLHKCTFKQALLSEEQPPEFRLDGLKLEEAGS